MPSFTIDRGKLAPLAPYLLPVFGVLSAVFLTVLVTIPRFNSISDLKREKGRVEARLVKLEEKRAALEELLAYKGALTDNFNLLSTALPDEEAVPILMTQVQQIATDSGVGMSSLKYAGGKKVEAAKGSPTAAQEIELGRVRLQAVVEAPYSFLQGFISNLENASRVVNVDSIKFSKRGREEVTVSATLDLVSFYVPIPEEEVVVDAPISLDLGSPEFTELMKKVKTLKVYEVKVVPGGVGKSDPFAT